MAVENIVSNRASPASDHQDHGVRNAAVNFRSSCCEAVKERRGVRRGLPFAISLETSESGHLEGKLTAAEPKRSRSTGRRIRCAIPDHDRRPKVKISDAHQRTLTNHKPKRAKNGDSHAGYIHPDLDDLRASQQAMTDYPLAGSSRRLGRERSTARPTTSSSSRGRPPNK